MRIDAGEIGVRNRILVERAVIDIPSNGITVIEGGNGTGKTLLLRKLFRSVDDLGVLASYVEQDNDYLLPRSGIIENVSLSSDAKTQKKTDELLELFGMKHLKQHKTSELSGGEKRILCIFRAICICDPSGVIFLDEPTNDLDYQIVNVLCNLFLRLKTRCSLVIVTHDDRITKISDSIYRIENQKLLGQTTGFNTDEVSYYATKKKEYNEKLKIIGKSVIFKGMPLFSALLLVLISIFGTLNFIQDNHSVVYDCTEKEVDFVEPTTLMGTVLLNEEALPAGMLELMRSAGSINDISKKYEELLNKEVPISYELDGLFDKETKHSCYKLELYSLEERTYYYPMEYYNVIAALDDDVFVDTSGYFISDFSLYEEDHAKRVDFDPKVFNKCLDKLISDHKNEHLVCTYLVMMLDENESLYDYIESSYAEDVFRGDYYVRAKELSMFSCQIKEIINQRNQTIATAGYCICIILTGIMLIVLSLHISRKSMRIALDIGIEKKHAQSFFSRFFCAPTLSVFTVLLCFVADEIVLAVNNIEDAPVYGICFFICAVAVVIMYKIKKLIVSMYINRQWRWDNR